MIDIENNTGQGNLLGLINNLPKEVLNKLNISNFVLKEPNEEIEVVIISGDSVDNLTKFVDNLGGKYEDLGYGFGLVTIPLDKIIDLALNTKIQYIELPKSLYLTYSNSNSAACIPASQESYGLYGEGVLVGFIDTGIDYTHPAFINDDGTTRIEYIYDLSEEGTVYSKEDINRALKSPNPYSIVNSIDVSEHGTHVAGIACAGGKIAKEYYGVAPKSSIAMVKVARAEYALSTFIIRGLRFLINKSKELEMPLVVNISLSTNDGAHDGSSLLEQYIETVSSLERVSIIIAAGNEGEAAHHVGGEIEDVKEISFNVADDESIVAINLYKSLLVDMSIELRSPSGETTGERNLLEGIDRGAIGTSRYQIYITGPKPFDINGEIMVVLTGVGNYVTSGEWKVVLRKLNDYDGHFDMWLPISEGLNTRTKFLQPTIENTLGIPATVRNVISVGSYNYLTNTISPFSGRGNTIYPGGIVKPDVVAPGEDIYSTVPNRSFDKKTGTSMATPHITGVAALMIEWGIVKKNDPYLYGDRLRYYLVEGAKRDRSDIIYPDISWGYGEACAKDSLDIVYAAINNISRENKKTKQRVQVEDTTKATTQPNVNNNTTGNQTNVPIQSNINNNVTEDNTKVTTEPNVDNNTTGSQTNVPIQPNINNNVTEDKTNVTSQANINNTTSEPNVNDNIESTENETNDKEDTIFVLSELPFGESLDKVLSIPGVQGVRISEQIAILIVPVSKYDEVTAMVERVIDIEQPTLSTLSQITPLQASGSGTIINNPYLRLNGTGVMIGIIDTGIDYLNKEFQREDDTTRIFRLWDQTIDGDKEIFGLKYGVQYTEKQINRAIELQKNGGDPYTIVPSKDEIGHGTMMAGIAGGRGINPDLKGAAPNCDFIIVKLAEASKTEKERAYIETNIPTYTPLTMLLALRYITLTANKYNKPVVVYIPLGSNMGSHNGGGIMEGSIDNYVKQAGKIAVTSAGNQGNTETHTEGVVKSNEPYKDIELRIGKNQKILPIQVWIKTPNRVSLSIISPSGEVVSDLTSKNTNNRTVNFLYEGTEMIVDFTNPEPITGDGVIFIRASNLREGIWRLRLIPEYILDGQYYAWIPQRELIEADTKFLSPSENTTITLPGTSKGAITVGYYNQENNTVVGESGRGFTTNGLVRPDIVAGGINALAPKVGGGTTTISGSSVAGAVVTGCCALILQWAIVDKNDTDLYTPQIRSYIISGASGREGDIYPNREWGYGRFDLSKVFDVIREVYEPKSRGIDEDIEYNVGKLFVRKPKEL